MRVEFCQRENSYDAVQAAQGAVESYFLHKIFWEGHPIRTLRGAIDGVSISSSAGFPKMEGWRTAIQEIMTSFVGLRMNWMNTVLSLTIEHNGHQPLSLGGSFFFRATRDGELFLEVNFREELDGECADPMAILGFYQPEDFTLARILMAGQRKLTIGEIDFKKYSDCHHLVRALARALQSQQGYYRWKNEGTLDGHELRSELPLRAARLELAMIEEGFCPAQGTLGPTLRHLAEQYLV